MTPQQIDRYQIRSEQGRGGMATVYRAYDPGVGREVAIKVLPPQFTHDPLFRERFDREARTIISLEHSAIVPIYDFGEEQDQPYLVMRYMPGGSLAERLKEGPLTVSECAAILQRIGPALDEAHKRGIIHRDLKPGNILFDQYGAAFLSDFGIAKLSEATAALTGSAIIGTPAYMSPEQARGDPDIDGRSDIYSLGVILFEMLSGEAPYEADTPMGVAIKHILDPIPRIQERRPDLPLAVDSVITRAMAKDASARFQTAAELTEALVRVAAGEPLPAAVEEAAPRRPSDDAGPQTIPLAPPVEINSPPDPGSATHFSAPTPPVVPASELKAAAPGSEAATARVDERRQKHLERQARRLDPEARSLRRRRWTVGCLLALLVLGISSVGGLFGILRGPFARLAEQGRSLSDETEMVAGEVSEELGGATSLDVTLELLAADTVIAGSAGKGLAVEGSYTLTNTTEAAYEILGERAVFRLGESKNSDSLPIPGGDGEATLALARDVPIDLTIRTGAGSAKLDLSELTLSSLRVEGGAGLLEIILPAQGDLDISITGGLGEIVVETPEEIGSLHIGTLVIEGGVGSAEVALPITDSAYSARITSGVGSIEVTVPETLPARVEVESGFSNIEIGDPRFTAVGEGSWETPDYGNAKQQVLIQIESGLGSVRIDN